MQAVAMTEEKKAPEAKPKAKLRDMDKPKALLQSRFKMAQHGQGHFHVLVPVDHEYEDVLRREFWVNVQPTLKWVKGRQELDFRGSLIDVFREDMAWHAQLRVTAIVGDGLSVVCQGPSFDVKTGKKMPMDLDTELAWKGDKPVKEGEPYEKNWNIGKMGYDIVRTSDRELVADGSKIKTKAQAEHWINEALKAA